MVALNLKNGAIAKRVMGMSEMPKVAEEKLGRRQKGNTIHRRR